MDQGIYVGRTPTARIRANLEELYISTLSAQSFDAAMTKLSGDQDLLRLTPAQVDRLEPGFQQAITDDRRLNRFYLAIAHSYGDAVAGSK